MTHRELVEIARDNVIEAAQRLGSRWEAGWGGEDLVHALLVLDWVQEGNVGQQRVTAEEGEGVMRCDR